MSVYETVHIAAGANSTGSTADMLPQAVQSGVSGLEALPHDLQQLPGLQQLGDVIPAADLLYGGGMLLFIVLIHATGVRIVTGHVAQRSTIILKNPTAWRADLLMSSAVFMLLALHLAEIVIWAAALVYSGLVSDWRSAGFFAGNTYTTVGYGAFVLPLGWHMLAPIMAISGLFTFGWSGSVLVDLVGRCQKIKDAAVLRRAPGKSVETVKRPR
ncbi:MAG TPA: ion channel [Casimicrobiaceae bacterium]